MAVPRAIRLPVPDCGALLVVVVFLAAACSSKPDPRGGGGTAGTASGDAGTGGTGGTPGSGGEGGGVESICGGGGRAGAGGVAIGSGAGGSGSGGRDTVTGPGGAGGPALSCDSQVCAVGTVCSRLDTAAPCYDPTWAAWPMPNSFTSVSLPAGGTVSLPNPKSYDTTSIDGVVVDNVTGLQWQRAVGAPSGAGPGGSDAGAGGAGGGAPATEDGAVLVTRSQAITRCATLSLAGGGWRVPTRIELVSIVDTTRSNPSIDVTAFPDTPVAAFWTLTSLAGSPLSAWIIYLSDGNTSYYDVGNRAAVRCVR